MNQYIGWYVIYSRAWNRLVIDGVSLTDAMRRATQRWRKSGLSTEALEGRLATPNELQAHINTVEIPARRRLHDLTPIRVTLSVPQTEAADRQGITEG